MNVVNRKITIKSSSNQPANPELMEFAFSDWLVLSRSHRILQNKLNQILKPLNISFMEWILLGNLAEHGRKGLKLQQIADEMAIKTSQLTKLGTKLQKLWLVRQRTQNSDRRSRNMIITAKGKTTYLIGLDQLAKLSINIFSYFPANFTNIYLKVNSGLAYRTTAKSDRIPGNNQ